jgi:heme A synthase
MEREERMTTKFFRRYSWGLVLYNVMVILWGAVVRATGSGAGCGSHWPLCNGEVIPQSDAVATTIEFIHRITSGFDGILVIALLVMAYSLYGKKSKVTFWAFLALVFIIIEGLLGRMLVVQEWVGDNVSVMRAIVVAVHLANTYILLLTLTVTAWLAQLAHKITMRGDRLIFGFVLGGLLLSILFSAMGAVTALGDTLFPPESESFLMEVQRDFDPASNFLIRLRVIHPVLAILSGGYLFFMVRFIQQRLQTEIITRRGYILIGAMVVQALAGGFTILTLAPLFMQMLHLLLADIFWILLVLFALEAITKPVRKSG